MNPTSSTVFLFSSFNLSLNNFDSLKIDTLRPRFVFPVLSSQFSFLLTPLSLIFDPRIKKDLATRSNRQSPRSRRATPSHLLCRGKFTHLRFFSHLLESNVRRGVVSVSPAVVGLQWQVSLMLRCVVSVAPAIVISVAISVTEPAAASGLRVAVSDHFRW